MRFLPAVLALTLSILSPLRATDLPTIKAPLVDIATGQGNALASIDLRNHFEITSIVGQVVQFRTTQGTYNLEMVPAAPAATVANFLAYVNGARFANTLIHRSDQGLGIIQGGGYAVLNPSPLSLGRIATNAPIALEYNLPNTRGTIAMARTSTLNSATSEWFINTVDNTTTLGAANNGGYAVFGRVTGTGLTVVDAIQVLQVYAFSSPYGQIPLTGYSGTGAVAVANLIVVNAAEAVPLFPATAGQNAVATFSVANTNPALVTPIVSGSALNLALIPNQSGVADVTVTATDSNGNAVLDTFRVTVNGMPTLNLPVSPVVAEATSTRGATVSFLVTANDPEDGALTPTVTPVSGSVFAIGDTTVNVSATDSNGARTTGSFVVRVAVLRPAATRITQGVRSGEDVPGSGIGTLPAGAIFTSFGPPALSDARQMVARAVMLAGRKSVSGIVIENGAGTPNLRAYQGGAAPEIAAVETTFKSFMDPVTTAGGAIAFAATLQGGGVRVGTDSGVWTDTFGGSLELALREGDDVPGLPVGAKLKSVNSLSLRDGELIALVTLSPAKGIVATGDDTVLLRMTSPTVANVLLREGRELTGFAGSKIKSFSVLSPALGSPGHGRWHSQGGVVAKVTLIDGRTLIVKIGASGVVTSLISTADDPTPISSQARWKGFGLPSVGSNGTGFVLAATLLPGAGEVTASTDTALLFSATGTTWATMAREGDQAPGLDEGALYSTFFDPVVNDAGRVAFLATLKGAGINAGNKTALFGGLATSPQPIARVGQEAPNESGVPTDAVWTKFVSFALPGGNGAGALFLAETAGGDTTAKNKLGLWAVNSSGTLLRLARTGVDPFGQSGSVLTGMTLLNAAPGVFGTSRNFNATGSVALLAAFADKTQRLLRIDIP